MGSEVKFHPSPSAFIGRASELAELRVGLDDAIAGHGRLFLISGEPGIGKTRTTNELALRASQLGARVMWGRCWEGHGAPAFWPWIQIVRGCVGDHGSERLSALLNSDVAEVTELLPEIAQRRRSSPAVARLRALPSSDPEQARFRLFDSAARLLLNLAAIEPLMIVLDDLHDADQPSLLMLRFVARALGDARILVVGTYRETEVRRSPALTKLIGDLTRESTSLPLVGLSKAEVAQFVVGHAGAAPSSKLISMLHRATAGNPFFLDGIVRLLLAQQELHQGEPPTFGDLQIPDGVRDAIRRRLTALSPETNSVLSIASVIGQEFDVDCLQRVSESDPDSLLDSLDQAQRDGVIIEAHAARARRRFCHDLIRETLYEDLPTASRLKLHRRIAQVLEELYAGNPEPHLSELAHHYRKATQSGETPSGEITKAIDYSIRAGAAARAVAYEETVVHWEAALALMERQPHTEERRADFCLRLSGLMTFIDRMKGLEYQEKALRVYKVLAQSGQREVWLSLTDDLPYAFSSLPMVMAQVHTNLGAYLATPGPWLNVQRSFEHLREAEALLAAEAQSDAGARLSSQIDFGLALAASRAMRNGEGMAASLRAMKTAEHLGQRWMFATSASQHGLHLFYAGRLAEGFALLDHAWEKADSFNEPLTAWGVTMTGGGCHFALLELEEARRWFERELSTSRNKNTGYSRRSLLGHLGQVFVFAGKMNQARPLLAQMSDIADYGNGQIAFWEGRWEQAERVWARDLERVRQGGGREEGHSGMLCWVRRILKQHSSAEALLHDALSICREERLQFVEMWARPELALLYAETDRCEEAVPHLARCREIMAAGEDWRGLAGGVSRAEAFVWVTQRRFEEAQAQFEKAIEIFHHYQMPLQEAESLYLWGRELVGAGRHAEGAERLDSAVDIYRRCGAGQPWIERALAATVDRPGASAGTTSEPARTEFAFRKQGDYWTISFKGELFRLKDAKGLHYIAHLLRHPGVEFSVIELANLTGAKGDPIAIAQPHGRQSGTDTATEIRSDLGDAGTVLDPKAKADYRRRLGELREELQEAELRNDLGRKERLREEFDFVTAEVAAAIGLRGKDRKTASHVERARSMVSNRIRFSMGRIGAVDSALGRHLNESIRTGYQCAYLPKQPVGWQF